MYDIYPDTNQQGKGTMNQCTFNFDASSCNYVEQKQSNSTSLNSE